MARAGNPIPLSLQLSDGVTNKFPQAHVLDATGTEISGSPVNLTHRQGGCYTSNALNFPATTSVSVRYVVYDDSGHTTESTFYTISQDIFELDDSTDATVGAAIKAKTDQLGFTSGNVNARAAVVADKTDYTLSSGGLTAVENTVWNANTAAHGTAGTMGEALTAATPVDAAAIADAVWDEAAADHTASGSMGDKLNTASSGGVSPGTIAAAVWDAVRTTYTTAGSFGQALQGVLSAARAGNLDNLNVAVNTLATASSVSGLSTQVGTRASQTSVDAIDTKLGTPAGASVSADIAAIGGQVTGISGFATSTQANSIIALLGAPAGLNHAADIAAVKVDTAALAAAYTSIRAAALDKIDVVLSTRATQTLQSDIYSRLGVPVTADLSHDIAAVKTRADALPLAADNWTYTTRALTEPVDANVDTSSLATAAQLTQATADIIATVGAFQVCSSIAIDPLTDIATIILWLELSGRHVTNPESAMCRIFNAGGVQVAAFPTTSSLTPQGTFSFTLPSASSYLLANRTYTIQGLVTDETVDHLSTKSFVVF